MKWIVSNLHVRVEGSDEERSWLDDYLVVKDRRFVARRGKAKYVENKIHLYNLHTDTFPAGLGHAVALAAKKDKGFTVTVDDQRLKPCILDLRADLEWLRHHPAANIDPIPHQIEAVEAVLKRGRGIIKVPTGGGKTEIACGLAKALPCKWLFLVHRGDLLHQTAARFKLRTGEDAGLVGDGHFAPARFTVAMFQTIHQGLKNGNPEVIKLLEDAEGALFDECHTLAADTFWDIAMRLRNAYYRVGLSGTPLQHRDKRSTLVLAALGPLIYRVSAKFLQEIGVLSRPEIRFVTVRQKSDKPTWQGVYGESIIKSKKRNLAVLGMIQRAARPCLVFVQQIKHGNTLKKMLGAKGIPCEFIWGKESTAERAAAVERLVRTDIEVLICNVIFQEGIDIPSLRSVVVATGGASPIAALQRVGRGMRAQQGKFTFEVWEVADKGCGCTPDSEEGTHSGCRWLEKHTRERIKAYLSEEYEYTTEDGQELLPLVLDRTSAPA